MDCSQIKGSGNSFTELWCFYATSRIAGSNWFTSIAKGRARRMDQKVDGCKISNPFSNLPWSFGPIKSFKPRLSKGEIWPSISNLTYHRIQLVNGEIEDFDWSVTGWQFTKADALHEIVKRYEIDRKCWPYVSGSSPKLIWPSVWLRVQSSNICMTKSLLAWLFQWNKDSRILSICFCLIHWHQS